MMRPIRDIDFSHLQTAIPSYITMLIMPLTGSIAEGIVMGMLSYIILMLCIGEGKKLSAVMYVLGVIFILKYFVPLFF